MPLVALTLGKFFLNCVLRIPYVFLGDVSRGLGLTTAATGRLLGFGELVGLSSALVGRDLDRGRHRRWSLFGLGIAAVGSALIALFGVSWALVVGFAGVSVGISIFTTASHSFLGDQIPVERRGRAIGLYEVSWAAALFIGAPLAAVLIGRTSWTAPFAVLALLLLVAIAVLRLQMDARTAMRNVEANAHADGDGTPVSWPRVTTAILGSVFLTFGAVSTFASFGPWLEDRHGLKTGGLGAVAFGLGAMELLGSGGTAVLADRIGQRLSVCIGSAIMAGGGGVLLTVGASSKVFAVAGVLTLFGGFEFAYVSLLSVVSEVGGRFRGQVVAVDHALVTVSRAVGAGFGPWLAGKSSVHFGSVQTMVIALALVTGTGIVIHGRR